jgi:hypothetical protein
VDAVFTSVDGFADNQQAAKGTDFDACVSNLRHFVRKRDELERDIPVLVRSLTIAHYCKVLRANFGVDPAHVPRHLLGAPDDFARIRGVMRTTLNRRTDRHERTWPVLWAERENLGDTDIREKRYPCPQLFRNRDEVYVSPAGHWYLCCLDSRQELVIGDLTRTPLRELAECPRRRSLLRRLRQRRFSEIGGPCRTVHCCQLYHVVPAVSRLIRAFAGSTGLAERVFHRVHRRSVRH